jgi:hypothetical protein
MNKLNKMFIEFKFLKNGESKKLIINKRLSNKKLNIFL